MYLRVPCDVFKYAFMCTGTPASYAVCQASSSLILSILASYAVCQIALTAAIATVDGSPEIVISAYTSRGLGLAAWV
jgi:hypothetical protein